MTTATLTYSPGWAFNCEPPDETIERRLKIKNADEWEVRELWFTGSVLLRIGDVNFEYRNTPLLDFGMALQCALHLLAAEGGVDFVVNGGARILFSLHGSKVESLNRGDVGECEYVHLVAASTLFVRNFIDECTKRFPEALINDVIERLFRESGVRELGRDRFLLHSQAVRIRESLRQ
jgi:hypothetical protein